MEKIFVEKPVQLVKHLILLEGISRAGKFFLGKLISNFENTEYYQYLSVLEHVPYILKVGGMTEDAATALIKMEIEESFYYSGLGRNINLRYDDASSVYHSLEMDEYLRRSITPYGKELKTEILKNSEIRSAFYIIPDTFPNVGVFFKAYPNLKLIKEIRHPIDLIYSCYVNGFGWRHHNDPLAFHMVMKGMNAPIPWYAIDWQEEYENLSDADRVIKCIALLFRLEIEAYAALTAKQKQQILVVRYENLVEETYKTLEQMGEFLKKEPHSGISTILARERVPRKLPQEEQEKKAEILKEATSKECYAILMDLASDYDNNKFSE